MTHLGWKTIFIGLVTEAREAGRVVTQKPCLLDLARVINVLLNQDTVLSPLNSYCSFQIYKIYTSGQPRENYAILNLVAPLLALRAFISENLEINLLFILIKAIVIFTLIYLTLNLIAIIYLVLELPLSNLSYIILFKFWVPFTC